ncbi:MAG: signal peptidase II [Thermodesulfovibrionales bacterium]|nr:signal peptidase II [Thermodesulfovibrionales bacterium]
MKKTYLALILLTIISDQITKYLTDKLINPLESIEVLPFLHLVNVRNKGAAFGMFKSFGNEGFIIISLLAIIVIGYMFVRWREDKLGLSLILAGAIGNLIDRLFYGSVRDFVDVFAGRFHWPAFNIADSALTIGIGIIFISLFTKKN